MQKNRTVINYCHLPLPAVGVHHMTTRVAVRTLDEAGWGERGVVLLRIGDVLAALLGQYCWPGEKQIRINTLLSISHI